MSLAPGTKLGPYVIDALIGTGGMGEVYRAKDTRLNRDVAIKVLPESFAADPDRRARFEREANAVAALSHPNIVAIFDTGAHDPSTGSGQGAQVFVVMELLTGQTLRTRLTTGALPVRKSVDIAVQIARGLGAAHGKGIVHRDLKPENVFLLDDGQVKILDFGLARQFGTSADGSDATRTVATDPGTVMGTLGYMSPEQVRGQATDARADVFSFGAVLYEMVSGQRAYQRDTAADTMTAIISQEPPELSTSRGDVPPSLERIIRHCLEKNLNERFQSARDVAFALEALSGTGVNVPSNAVPVAQATALSSSKGGRIWPLVAALALIAGGLLGMFAERTRTPPAANVRYSPLTWENEWITNARFAPDGQSIVYSSARSGTIPSLFVMRTGEVVPQQLAGPGTHLLSVSATGELAVITGATNLWGHRVFSGTLSRMSSTGGARAWMDHVTEADFSPDGATLAIIRENAGTWQLEYPVGKVLHTVKSGYLSDPRVSPDGQHVAFFEHQLNGDNRGNVKVVDKAGTVTVLSGDYWGEEGVAWSRDGKTIYYSAGDSTSSFQVFGVNIAGAPKPHQVLSGAIALRMMDVAADGRMLVAQDITRSGLRVQLPGESSERELSWLDFSLGPFLTTDGRHMAFSDLSQSAGSEYAVAWRDTAGGPVIRLGKGFATGLSPDGRWVAGAVPSSGAFVLYPTGAGEAVNLPGLIVVENFNDAKFLRDSKRFIACGIVAGKPSRCYRSSIDRPALDEPVTPDGSMSLILAPDDKTMVARFTDGTWRPVLSPTEFGPAIPSITGLDQPVSFTLDQRSIIVGTIRDVPMRVERVDIVTGARTLIKSLSPIESAAVNRMTLTEWREGDHAYAYSYIKQLTQLFTVTGVVR